MKEKKIHLEVVRIIAIYLVVLTHTGTRGFTWFTQLEPSVGYFLAMCVPVACNVCVPLFYMVSGATLIGKDESPGTVWRHRIVRYLMVLVLACLMMYGYYSLRRDEPMSIAGFLTAVYSRNIIPPYWYLYSYLGFLIMLPFLRKLIRGLSDREFLYLMAMHLVFRGAIPMLQYRLSGGSLLLNKSLDLFLVTSDLVVFPAAGYYLEQHRLLRWKEICLLWLATAVAVAATLYMTHYKIQLTGQLREDQVGTFYKCLCLIPTVTVYATVKKGLSAVRLPQWGQKVIVTLGSCTFGVYLIEQILRERGYKVWQVMAQWLPRLPATFIYVGLVVATATCVTLVAKRIPGLKKLI